MKLGERARLRWKAKRCWVRAGGGERVYVHGTGRARLVSMSGLPGLPTVTLEGRCVSRAVHLKLYWIHSVFSVSET